MIKKEKLNLKNAHCAFLLYHNVSVLRVPTLGQPTDLSNHTATLCLHRQISSPLPLHPIVKCNSKMQIISKWKESILSE